MVFAFLHTIGLSDAPPLDWYLLFYHSVGFWRINKADVTTKTFKGSPSDKPKV